MGIAPVLLFEPYSFTKASCAQKRWSRKQKELLRESRFRTTDNCVKAIAGADSKPRVFVSASAIGYYGFTGNEELSEDAPAGDDFLAKLCAEWEARSKPAEDAGVRTVQARIGVVLAPSGGALSAMLFPFKMFVGGPVLPGTQYMSWIHIDDIVGIIVHAIEGELRGPVNMTSPNPATNRDFSAALGRALGRPSWLPVPKFGLRVLFGQIAEIIAAGQRVVPTQALDAGYPFQHPDLDAALRDVLSPEAVAG